MLPTRSAQTPRFSSRWRTLTLGAVLLLPALGGCGKLDELGKAADRSAPIEFDMARLSGEFKGRVSAAVSTAPVEGAAKECFEAVAADPLVAASGERLLGALAESPKLAVVGQSIIQSLGESKQLQQIVTQLIADNPGMSPDAVGDAVAQRIERVTSGPAFNRAFDQSFDKVLAAPAVVKAINDLQTAIANNPYLVGIIEGAVNAGEHQAAWSKRLTELNGGKRPSPSEATSLLLDHWFTPARLEDFYVKQFSLPATREQIRIALIKLMDSPSFVAHLSDALESIAQDPRVQQQVVDVLNTMLLDDPSEADIIAVLDPLLTKPAVAVALANFVDALVQDPELAPIGVATLEAIAKDESVRALINELMTDW